MKYNQLPVQVIQPRQKYIILKDINHAITYLDCFYPNKIIINQEVM